MDDLNSLTGGPWVAPKPITEKVSMEIDLRVVFGPERYDRLAILRPDLLKRLAESKTFREAILVQEEINEWEDSIPEGYELKSAIITLNEKEN